MSTILDEPYSKLPQTKLPTIGDALKAIYFEQNVRKQTKEAAIRTVANQIKYIWQKTTVPSVTVQRIVQKLTELCETLHRLNHTISTPAMEEKKNSFKVKRFCCCFVRMYFKVFNQTDKYVKTPTSDIYF